MKKGIQILIVEDEVISARMLMIHLKKAGYEKLDHATTGEKALILAEKIKPDLLIMDIRLAGELDGFETAEIICRTNNTKVLFVTGYNDSELRNRAETLSPVGYLLKPVDIRILDSLMESMIQI